MKKIFALKDNEGKYVDKTSLYYDINEQRVIYDCYNDFRDTVVLYYEEDADKWITYLNEKAREFGLNCNFEKEYVRPDYSDS